MRTAEQIKKELKEELEKNLSNYVFKQNTKDSRLSLTLSLSNICENYRLRRKIYDYRVVADESNNIPNTIEYGLLVVDVYLEMNRGCGISVLDFILSKKNEVSSKKEFEDYEDTNFEEWIEE